MILKTFTDPIPADAGPEFCAWAANAKVRGVEHFGTLGVIAGDQTKFFDWCDMAMDACAGTDAAEDDRKAWTAYRKALLNGSSTTNQALSRPVSNTPPAPTLTTPLLPGVMSRIRDFLQEQKRKAAWTAGMEQDFRLTPGVTLWDTNMVKPVLKMKSLTGAKAEAVWVAGPFKAMLLEWKRDGETAWRSLGALTGSRFLHEQALAVAGVPEQRQYRARYQHRNAAVGEWSDTVPVTIKP